MVLSFQMPNKNDNARAVQCNPNNPKGGQGHQAGFKGDNNQPQLDNHGNQLNPNNPQYGGGRR